MIQSRVALCCLWAIATLRLLPAAQAADAIEPFLGRWALTIPGGEAGWLGVTREKGYYDATLLWDGGSVEPVASVFVVDGILHVTRNHKVERKDATGKVVRTQEFTELITARVKGDTLELVRFMPRFDGTGLDRATFQGRRIPDLPPAPDLTRVKFGPALTLFNGRTLDGWELTDRNAVNGWSVRDGILVNRPVQEEGKPRKNYGNLRTVREFEDFNLKLEVRVAKDGNSGVYLRGIYEVQVTDSYGKGLDSHNMGAIYSRITPTESAEKPAGAWQNLDITLVDRHVTVLLNGRTVVNNQPLMGCTGGALWSDEFRPGPIYLQGDHTGAEYRNLMLRPVAK